MHKRISSHGDYDHLGEALSFINYNMVEKIYLNQGKFNYYEKKIIDEYADVYQIRENEQLFVGDVRLVEINKKYSDENDSSSVFIMEYKKLRILLTGYASKKSEEYI